MGFDEFDELGGGDRESTFEDKSSHLAASERPPPLVRRVKGMSFSCNFASALLAEMRFWLMEENTVYATHMIRTIAFLLLKEPWVTRGEAYSKARANSPGRNVFGWRLVMYIRMEINWCKIGAKVRTIEYCIRR